MNEKDKDFFKNVLIGGGLITAFLIASYVRDDIVSGDFEELENQASLLQTRLDRCEVPEGHMLTKPMETNIGETFNLICHRGGIFSGEGSNNVRVSELNYGAVVVTIAGDGLPAKKYIVSRGFSVKPSAQH